MERMRQSPTRSSKAEPAVVSTKPINTRRARLRTAAGLRRCLPVVGILKIASGEVFADAAAAAVDATMGVAMDVARRGSRFRSRGSHGLRPRALRLLLFLLLVPGSQAGASSLGRRRDTSRYCFLENRFPSTGAWRRRRWCGSQLRRT